MNRYTAKKEEAGFSIGSNVEIIGVGDKVSDGKGNTFTANLRFDSATGEVFLKIGTVDLLGQPNEYGGTVTDLLSVIPVGAFSIGSEGSGADIVSANVKHHGIFEIKRTVRGFAGSLHRLVSRTMASAPVRTNAPLPRR